MSKYYTPELEEFHVGFEYEHEDDPRIGTWKKEIVDENTNLKWFKEDCDVEHRVKCLDKEDIESLGFEYGEYSKARSGGETFELHNRYSDVWTIHAIGSDYREQIFKGVIKNKSELKRILKQVGYE